MLHRFLRICSFFVGSSHFSLPLGHGAKSAHNVGPYTCLNIGKEEMVEGKVESENMAYSFFV